MNEGENSGMPKAPGFSSPNTSPDNPAPIRPAAPADSQPAQPAASVYSAAASLPEEDPSQPTQAISSGGPTRPRFGFSRRFKDQQPAQPRTAAFNNAPDFFNQAVGDIVVANDNAVAQKQKTKKFIILSAAVLGVLAIVLVVVFFVGQASKPSANKVKTAFNRYANYVLYGEEKDSDIGEYDESARYTIMDKYISVDENYNKRFKELFDAFYKEYNDAAKAGTYQEGALGAYRDLVTDVYNSFDMDKKVTVSHLAALYRGGGGQEGAMKTIDDELATFKGEAESASDLAVSWREYAIKRMEVVKHYIANGCLSSDNELNPGCAVNENGRSAIKEANKAYEYYNDYKMFSRASLIEETFRIKEYENAKK